MARKLVFSLLVAAVPFFASGCAEPLEELGEFSCTRNGKCPLGYGCKAGKCLPTSELVSCTGLADGDVKVTALQRFVTEAGTTERPAEWDVGAYSLADDVPSDYVSAKEATGAAQLTIPSADERFMLRFHRYFNVTSCRELDMTEYFLGRQERKFGESESTAMSLTVQNLRPWNTSDVLQVVAPSAALYVDNFASWSEPRPQEGSTSASMHVSFRSWPLIERDTLYVSQLSTVSSGAGFDLQVLDRMATVPPEYTMSEGAVTSFSVTLDTVPPMTDSPQSSRLRAAYDPSKFEVHASKLGSGLVQTGHELYVTAPVSLELANHARPDLVRASIPAGTAAFDVPLPLHQAYPGRPKLFSVGVTTRHARSASFADPVNFRGGVVNRVQLNGDGSAPPSAFEVNVSPVRDPQINEESLLSAQEGVGLTPTLNWGAPLVGEVSRYLVILYKLEASGGSTFSERVATFQTRENSLVIPELPSGALLEEGEEYLVAIQAVVAPNARFDVKPFDASLPLYEATFISAVFKP